MMATKREKPFCRTCKTSRLPQKWDVIDRARVRGEVLTCSALCRKKRDGRQELHRRRSRVIESAEVERLMNRVAFTPRKPPKKFPVITESGAIYGSRRHKQECAEAESRAKDLALSRAAAKTWMVEVECVDAGEALLQNRADAAEWMA